MTHTIRRTASFITASGVTSGTPTTAGPYTFCVAANDPSGCVAVPEYSLDVPACTLPATPSTVLSRAKGEPFLITVADPCGTCTAESSASRIQAGTPVTSGGITQIVIRADINPGAAYLLANDEVRALPAGASIEPATGRFYRQPGAGFVGTYLLVFVWTACDGARAALSVFVAIR